MVLNDPEINQQYYSYGPAAYNPALWNITEAKAAQFSVHWTGDDAQLSYDIFNVFNIFGCNDTLWQAPWLLRLRQVVSSLLMPGAIQFSLLSMGMFDVNKIIGQVS